MNEISERRKCHDRSNMPSCMPPWETRIWRCTILNRAIENTPVQLVRLQVNPAYDDMRTDPRFQDLIHRIGLPQNLASYCLQYNVCSRSFSS